MIPTDHARLLDCLRQAEAGTDDETRWTAYLLRESLFPASREGMRRALDAYSDAINRGDLGEAGRRAADVRRIMAALLEPLDQTRH